MDRKSELEHHLAFVDRLLEMEGYSSDSRDRLLMARKQIEEELTRAILSIAAGA
jgi:hypothetical protein